MEATTQSDPTAVEASRALACLVAEAGAPFSQQWVTITKQEHIELFAQARYRQAQHAHAKSELDKLTQESALKDAEIKDLRNRLFGKKSEKNRPLPSERDTPVKRRRGQQPGSPGHDRTKRTDLPIIHEVHDLSEEEKRCPTCGLPRQPNPAMGCVCPIGTPSAPPTSSTPTSVV